MGRRVEKEKDPFPKRKSVDGLHGEEEQPIGSLFKLKKAKLGKNNKKDTTSPQRENDGNLEDFGKIGGDMGDTLACLRRKLKAPRRVKPIEGSELVGSRLVRVLNADISLDRTEENELGSSMSQNVSPVRFKVRTDVKDGILEGDTKMVSIGGDMGSFSTFISKAQESYGPVFEKKVDEFPEQGVNDDFQKGSSSKMFGRAPSVDGDSELLQSELPKDVSFSKRWSANSCDRFTLSTRYSNVDTNSPLHISSNTDSLEEKSRAGKALTSLTRKRRSKDLHQPINLRESFPSCRLEDSIPVVDEHENSPVFDTESVEVAEDDESCRATEGSPRQDEKPTTCSEDSYLGFPNSTLMQSEVHFECEDGSAVRHHIGCTDDSLSIEETKMTHNDGFNQPNMTCLEDSSSSPVKITCSALVDMQTVDMVVTPDTEHKEEQNMMLRTSRKVKKHRHNDMAYEGDAYWEVLMNDELFESTCSVDDQKSTRSRDKISCDRSLIADGCYAAVAAGLKAHAASPIEKIIFKDMLKQKSGLHDYLQYRNLIFGLWIKDVRHVLTFEDCTVTGASCSSDSRWMFHIRDIYSFLDSRGYINTGIALDRKTRLDDGYSGLLSNGKTPNESSKDLISDINDSSSHVYCHAVISSGTSAASVIEMENLKTASAANAESVINLNVDAQPASPHSTIEMHGGESVKVELPQEQNTEINDGCTNLLLKHAVDCKRSFAKNEMETDREFCSADGNANQIPSLLLPLDPLEFSPSEVKFEGNMGHTLPAYTSVCETGKHPPLKDHNVRKSDEDARKRVIVIGAGPAGLTAARHLQCQGFSVTVLEARERIGGRVYTDYSSLSVPVDLGASIITGVEADIATERRPDPSSLVCSQLGIELTVLNSDCPLYDIVTGQKVPPELDEALEAEYNNLLDNMDMLIAEKGGVMEMSLEEGLEYALKKCYMSKSATLTSSQSTICNESKSLESLGKDSAFLEDGLSKVKDINGAVQDVLSPIERRVMDWHFAHLEYGCAASLKDVSLPHWNQDDAYGGFGGAHCMVKGGFGKVTESLAKGLTVHLNHVVTEITYDTRDTNTSLKKNEVRVLTSCGSQYIGDAALITVPLGCLKTNSIKFSPPLPDWKQLSIQRLGFGVLNKVVLEFPEVFWDVNVDYFGATAEDTSHRGRCFMFWNVKKTVGAPVLIALVAGRAAIDPNSCTSDHVSHSLKILRKLFGEASVPDPIASVVTNWGMDPFSRGAYSYVAVGASGDDYDVLGRPVANCLFFAGEATCKEHPDTVGGAMLSGLREAVRMIDIFKMGEDYISQAEAVAAAQMQVDNEKNEVKDFIRRLDSFKLSNGLSRNTIGGPSPLFTREMLLQDMFCNAKTTSGRLLLAKELLHLPVEILKLFAGTKEGLSILNCWILDSMGKDATQLLRHCVRLLVIVSTDLLAVRLSGIGKTIKDKVCVHTSRDIRAVASQLVNVWIEVLRKEKTTNGSVKLLRQTNTLESLKHKSKDQSAKKPPLSINNESLNRKESFQVPLSAGSISISNSKKKIDNWASKTHRSALTSTSLCSLDTKADDSTISAEEAAALAAAEAAHAAALAAAEAYASSEAGRALHELPKIPSFHKFARREHAQMDDFDTRKKLSGEILGRQDCFSEIDSRNCRVREWSVGFSAARNNHDGSVMAVDSYTSWEDHSVAPHPIVLREHLGDSTVLDGRLKKAWVDVDGADIGGVKDYTAIERWQSEAMDACSDFFTPMHLVSKGDSTKILKSPPKEDKRLHGGSCASQATESVSLSECQPRGAAQIKQGVVDYVASLLMPLYKTRKIDKEGYKSIMKKTANKVMEQCTEAEKVMTLFEFLDFKRKNKIRAFVDKLIERQLSINRSYNL